MLTLLHLDQHWHADLFLWIFSRSGLRLIRPQVVPAQIESRYIKKCKKELTLLM